MFRQVSYRSWTSTQCSRDAHPHEYFAQDTSLKYVLASPRSRTRVAPDAALFVLVALGTISPMVVEGSLGRSCAVIVISWRRTDSPRRPSLRPFPVPLVPRHRPGPVPQRFHAISVVLEAGGSVPRAQTLVTHDPCELASAAVRAIGQASACPWTGRQPQRSRLLTKHGVDLMLLHRGLVRYFFATQREVTTPRLQRICGLESRDTNVLPGFGCWCPTTSGVSCLPK